MERIRALVRAEALTGPPASTATERILSQLERYYPTILPQASASLAYSDARDGTRLRAEVEACESAAAMVGELNPRHPGFLNNRIQSVKRLMRRSLGWYTRPLRLFHGAVIRALQQIVVALERRPETGSISDFKVNLDAANRRLDDVELGTCRLYEVAKVKMDMSAEQWQATSYELTALREEVRQLRAQLGATQHRLKEFTTSQSAS